MSFTYGFPSDQVISYVSSTVVQNYCIVASATFVVYDHVCTIADEVQLIWGRKLTGPTILFYINRWMLMIFAILNVAQVFYHPQTILSCEVMVYIADVVGLCLPVLWAAFSAIRVYALSGGSQFLSFATALLNLVPVGTNAYGNFFGNIWQLDNFPVIGLQCPDIQNISEVMSMRLVIVTRLPVIVADAIVLIVAWSKTWRTLRIAREHNVKTPLITLLLRDGTLYFMLLLILNILNIVGWVTNVFVFAGDFSTSLGSIIITHFLLNLRQLSSTADNDNSHFSTSTLQFGSVVGNMGETLLHGSEHDDTDLTWDAQTDKTHPFISAEAMSSAVDVAVASACEHPLAEFGAYSAAFPA